MKKTVLGLLIFSVLNTANARIDKIPPGFEVIVLGQQEYVDVYLAGRHLGKFFATVNIDTVKFEAPQKIIAAMALDDDDKSHLPELTARLSQPLARNGELACSSINNSPGCGYLNPDDVALIYNDEQNAVTLFLNKSWYPDNSKNLMYLTPAHDESVVNAFIHQQDLNVAIQDDFKSAYLQGTGALGVTENSYIGGYWSLNSSESDGETETSADVNELYYRYDFLSRLYVQGGRMDSRGLFNLDGGNFNFSFLPLDAFDGVRAGSTLSYLNREQASQGTPVTVLLSRSSRVDAYRDNQLLGSFYLNGGNQTLDTSSFPAGSYTLQLKIYESNQLARTEMVPFTKTGNLSDGHIQWFIQAGKLADTSDYDEQERDNATAAQAGIRFPVTTQSEMMLGVASVDNDFSAEINGHVVPPLGDFGFLDLQSGFFYNDQGGRGNLQQLNWRIGSGPAINFYRKDTSGGQCSGDSNADDYDLNCFESISAGITQNVFGWNLALNWNRTRNHADYHTRWDNNSDFASNYFSQTDANTTSDSVQFTATRSFSFNNWIVNTNLGVFTRDDGGSNSNDNGGYLMFTFNETPRQDNNARSHTTTISTDYRTSNNSADQASWNLARTWYDDNVNHREVGVTLGGINTDTLDSSLNGRVDGLYGNLSANLSDSYDRQNQDHSTAFTGSYSSTLAISRHGIQIGRPGNGDPSAAVLVAVKNIEAESEAQLSIDAAANGSKASLTGDESVLFPYSSYEMGYVEVSDSSRKHQSGTTNLITGSGKQNLMLLPGKLRYREVSASFNYNYIGRLLLPDSVKRFPIIGLNSAMLLLAENGGFTLEMPGASQDLYVLAGQSFLKCPLKVVKKRASIRYAGDITCSVIAYDQLPPQIQVQAQLKQSLRKQALETAQRERVQ
ncbi:TcfC E-set like domain-containing protein [Pseudocitrobacter cyperus]|uniref:TcfC E-set like domain-containing protein n=1 Tax=Pseudocitrobacter cyperus TaxID=3112843 RepID=A0ABV0HKH6_9ENTR